MPLGGETVGRTKAPNNELIRRTNAQNDELSRKPNAPNGDSVRRTDAPSNELSRRLGTPNNEFVRRLNALPEQVKDYYVILSKKLVSSDNVTANITPSSDDYFYDGTPIASFKVWEGELVFCVDGRCIRLTGKDELVIAFNALHKALSNK